MDEINRDLLDKITQLRLENGVSNASVNRMLAVTRSILRKASIEWEWLDKPPKVRLLPEPNRRIRWITREQADCLLSELPSHLKAMARFSLETGLRQANVTGLQWSQVDLTRRCARLHPDQAKARRAISAPLSKFSVVILREQMEKHDKFVFSYGGKRITQVITKAWQQALSRVGIDNYRWYDLRDTWAGWHVQARTPLHVHQKLGVGSRWGWSGVTLICLASI